MDLEFENKIFCDNAHNECIISALSFLYMLNVNDKKHLPSYLSVNATTFNVIKFYFFHFNNYDCSFTFYWKLWHTSWNCHHQFHDNYTEQILTKPTEMKKLFPNCGLQFFMNFPICWWTAYTKIWGEPGVTVILVQITQVLKWNDKEAGPLKWRCC